MKDFIYANELKQLSLEKNNKRSKIYDKIIEKIVIRIKIIAANGLNNMATPKAIPINEKIEIKFKKPSFFLVLKYLNAIFFSK